MELFISEVKGNGQLLDGGAMFGNAPRAVWEKWIEPDSLGRIPLACRALLLETRNKKILFETGIGCFLDPTLAARYGVQNYDTHCLLDSLSSLGVMETDIDYIVLSHLHFDHAGGLLNKFDPTKAPELCFSKAKFIVGKVALERAINPHPRDRASFIPELLPLLIKSGRLIVQEEAGTFPDPDIPVQFFYSHGHTPGQMLSKISGHSKTVIFAGDLVPGSHWVHLPITMGYDRYPEMVIDEKHDLYSKHPSCHLFFTHDNQIVMGSLIKDEKGRFTLGEKSVKLMRAKI